MALLLVTSYKLVFGNRQRPAPATQVASDRAHFNTVNRARLNAEIATSTLADNYRVHLPGRTKNCVYGAGLNALGTANALILADIGDHGWLLAFGGIQ